MNHNKELTMIAGDDFTLAVDFYENGEAIDLSAGDVAELVIHYGEEERVIPADFQEGNTAKFYLSGQDTLALLRENPYGKFEYCVRVNWSGGGRDTPIHRQMLIIKRC